MYEITLFPAIYVTDLSCVPGMYVPFTLLGPRTTPANVTMTTKEILIAQ